MKKKHFILILKVFVSVGLIWILVSGFDLGAAGGRILNVDFITLGLAIFIFFVQLVICVVRWRVVLAAIGGGLSFLDSFHFYLVGWFFNQALPSSVGGDAVRIYDSYKRGLKLSCAFNSVMLERVATVFGLIIILVITAPFFAERVGDDKAGWIFPTIFMFGATGFAGLVLLMFVDRLPLKNSRWQFVRGLAVFAADARQVFLHPSNASKVLFWAIVGHANVSLAVYCLGLSIGLEITWLDCLALIPPILLIMALPISIAGWGVREGAMITAFGLIGVPGEGAFALSILFGLMGLLIAVPGGIVWLMRSNKKIDKLNTYQHEENTTA